MFSSSSGGRSSSLRRSSHPGHSLIQRPRGNSVTLFGSEAKRMEAVLALGQRKNGTLTVSNQLAAEHSDSFSQSSAKAELEATTTCSKITQCLSSFYKKSRLKHIFPIILIIGYAFLGGAVFYTLESDSDSSSIVNGTWILDQERQELLKIVKLVKKATLNKAEAMKELNSSVYWYALSLYCITEDSEIEHQRGLGKARYINLKRYTHELVERCWEITIEVNGNDKVLLRKIDEAIGVFKRLTLLTPHDQAIWTFWNAMFLAVTIFTTIGYGNIVPKTFNGRLAAVIYAVFGIPLFLMILHRMGRLFLALLQKLCDSLSWLGECCRCWSGRTKKLSHTPLVFETGRGSESYNVPVSLAVGVTFAWIFVCAAMFLRVEPSWDYFTSFYFVFISLTTIGFGDVTPTHSEDMFMTFGFIIVGLSLVSMCVNVVQIKLEHLFEDMMLMLMEEYQTALDSDMQGGPPDIKGRVGVMAMWRMLNRKKKHSVGHESASLFLPLMARKKQEALREEWIRKSQMRVKGTQTDETLFHEVSSQTESQPHAPPLHSPTSASQYQVVWTTSYLPQLPEVLSSRPSSRNSSFTQCSSSTNGLVVADIHANHVNELGEEAEHFVTENYERPLHLFKPRRDSQAMSSSSWPIQSNPEWSPGTRSWTFLPTAYTRRGSQRGLIPAMATTKQSKEVFKDDLKALMREIDLRLTDCRDLSGDSRRSAAPTPSLGEFGSRRESKQSII